MQENKRVYPRDRQPAKWFSYLLLFLSAVVVLSGLAKRSANAPSIQALATQTPIPLSEAFDETQETRELRLEGAVWYALQLGAFESEEAALELAEQYRPRGAAGYVWQDQRYRTLAAIYPTREDAQNVRRQLSQQHSIEAYLYEIPLSPLTLRVSGMKGQIDILEAAFAHARELVEEMHAISVRLDRQEMNAAEYAQSLESLKAQADLVALRLRQRFQTAASPTVESLCALFEEHSLFCAGRRDGESAVEYSQQIKHQAIRTLSLLRAIIDTLGNT